MPGQLAGERKGNKDHRKMKKRDKRKKDEETGVKCRVWRKAEAPTITTAAAWKSFLKHSFLDWWRGRTQTLFVAPPDFFPSFLEKQFFQINGNKLSSTTIKRHGQQPELFSCIWRHRLKTDFCTYLHRGEKKIQHFLRMSKNLIHSNLSHAFMGGRLLPLCRERKIAALVLSPAGER